MGAKATRTRRQPAPCGHPWHASHQRVRYWLAGVSGQAPRADAPRRGPRRTGARERVSEGAPCRHRQTGQGAAPW